MLINSAVGKLPQNKIFLVVPAYNEEKTVALVLEDLCQRSFNVVLVDDGSRDGTYDIVKDMQNKYPNHMFHHVNHHQPKLY